MTLTMDRKGALEMVECFKDISDERKGLAPRLRTVVHIDRPSLRMTHGCKKR